MMNDEKATDEAFEAAQRDLAEITKRAQENAARAKALADDVETIVGSARSARGEVTVHARVGGKLDSLVFADSAATLTLDDLAAVTLNTIAVAQHDAMMLLADRSEETFGADSGITQGMRRDASHYGPSDGGY